MPSSHPKHQTHAALPPSPPPSPAAARLRRRKHADSEFAKLAATPLPSPTWSATLADQDAPEPLLKRIVLTPVLFTSFLLSLFLVNAQSRARRDAAHTTPSSYLAYFFPASWREHEPYQDHVDSTWGRRGVAGHVNPHDAIAPKGGQLDGAGGAEQAREGAKKKKKREERWHLNKKIRKVARLEISDAFDSQGTVIVAMVAIVAFAVIGFWVGVSWIRTSMFR